jgi:hypothetical protein
MTTTATLVGTDTSHQQSAFFSSRAPTFTEERHTTESDGEDIHVDGGHSPRDQHDRAPRHNNQQERIKKRKKPTLNCLACVDRKSKCDRARPSCLLW